MANTSSDEPDGRRDRHKFRPFMVRLHPKIRQQLRVLAERNASDESTEARTAIRKYLEDAGLWPPPPES